MRTCSARSAALVTCLAALLVNAMAHAIEPKPPEGDLEQKEFFLPELAISSANVPLNEVLPALPNRAAWTSLLQARAPAGDGATRGFVDPRSGTATSLIGAFPLLPGRGVGNQVSIESLSARLGHQPARIDAPTVAAAILDFVGRYRELLAVDVTQLGDVRAVQVTPDLWQVHIPQVYTGVPVRHGRLAASISHGNLVVIGTETWGNVRGLRRRPAERRRGPGAPASPTRTAAGADVMVREPALEVIPWRPRSTSAARASRARSAQRLRAPAGLELRLPAPARGRALGGRWSTPTAARCSPSRTRTTTSAAGHGRRLPADQHRHLPDPADLRRRCSPAGPCRSPTPACPRPTTSPTAPASTTTRAAPPPPRSPAATCDIVDTCGAISASSATGDIDLGGANGQHDCTIGAAAVAGQHRRLALGLLRGQQAGRAGPRLAARQHLAAARSSPPT